jgi:hypothetical protein
MSEYQYYDFRAIDRPLTSSQRAELGKISTRAEVSSTSFTNFYTFGDFKGNPVALVERYFDAFLYLANWGTRELMFRVPLARAPAARVLRSYLSTRVQAAAWFRVRGTHVVIGLLSDDEEESWESDGEGELASIVPVRSDLLMGGVRVLYLGWLLRVQAGEVADDVAEPEVPAGLARLSGHEAALVEFLRMDRHLIAAAVQRRKGRPAKARTVGQLLSIAKARRKEAERRAAQRAQREREKRAAAEAVTRARHLRALAAREADAWRDVECLVESRMPAAYDQAVLLLQDLRDICDTTGRSSRFTRFVDELRQRHRAKVSLLKKLDGAMGPGAASASTT